MTEGHHVSPSHIDQYPSEMNNEHNAAFYAAVLTTRMPMIFTDPTKTDNPIVFANPAFMEMTGYSAEELIGHNCRLLQGPETDRAQVAEVRTAIANEKEIFVELLNYKKNGSTFWNALFISPVYSHDGKLIYFFASQLDVSRRHDAEEALRQSQKMEAVGQLTGGIAHDFNNLLQVITGFSELLISSIESDRFDPIRGLRSAKAINAAASKGAALTRQLLAFARKQKLQGRVVSLADLIDQLKPLIESSLPDGVDLLIKHQPKQCNAKVDVVQAELALLNIVINARDAMNDVGKLLIETKTVNLRAGNRFKLKGPYSYIKVTDTGEGMDAATIERAIEPFFTTKAEGKGTGLGLSMVYGFMKQSEGHFHIESEPGSGTSIYLLFKCADETIDVPIATAPSTPKHEYDETILVVEDRPDVLEYAEAILIDQGYTVLTAMNAKDAIYTLGTNQRIDMVFTDIMMPGGMHGIDLAREAEFVRPGIKILLTSGYAESSLERTDKNGRLYPFIGKPANRAEIVKVVRQVLDGPNGVS